MAIEDLTGEAVGKDPLHAVTRFDPDPPLFYREKDQYPFVFTLLPDPPRLVEAVCVIVRIVIADRLHRGHDDGSSGFFQNLPGEVFHRTGVLGGNHPGKVVDRSGGFRKGLAGRQCRCREKKERRREQQRPGRSGCSSFFHGAIINMSPQNSNPGD